MQRPRFERYLSMEQSSTRTTSTTTNDRKMQLLATDGEARTTTARGTLQGATTVESAAPTTRACSRHAKRGTKLPSALSHTHEQSQQTEQCWLLRSTTTPQIRIRMLETTDTRDRGRTLSLSHTNQPTRTRVQGLAPIQLAKRATGRFAHKRAPTESTDHAVRRRERSSKPHQHNESECAGTGGQGHAAAPTPTRQQRGRKQQQQQARKGRPRRCGIVRKTTRALEISLTPFSRCELCLDLDLDLAQCKNRSSSISRETILPCVRLRPGAPSPQPSAPSEGFTSKQPERRSSFSAAFYCLLLLLPARRTRRPPIDTSSTRKSATHPCVTSHKPRVSSILLLHVHSRSPARASSPPRPPHLGYQSRPSFL